ncbi:hypothetical protein [Nostoc sp. 106C]|uniref:hypothetical protein n=1 Tax=Nostoc sp. 106C TaxID=1932667 RepID=UPI00118148B1|nr:hypothetical protein [Nostoc sp. 106C]
MTLVPRYRYANASSRQSLQVGKAAQRAGSFMPGNPSTGLAHRYANTNAVAPLPQRYLILSSLLN